MKPTQTMLKSEECIRQNDAQTQTQQLIVTRRSECVIKVKNFILSYYLSSLETFYLGHRATELMLLHSDERGIVYSLLVVHCNSAPSTLNEMMQP